MHLYFVYCAIFNVKHWDINGRCNRVFYMSARHVLLNYLTSLGKVIKCEACNEFNEFNNTGVQMLDSNHHMALKSQFSRENIDMFPTFMQRSNGRHKVSRNL